MHIHITRHAGHTAYAAPHTLPNRLLPCLFVVVALLLCATPLQVAAADSTTPVYLLNATYSSNPYLQKQAEAVWLGVDVAMYAAQYTAADGRPIVILKPSADVDSDDIVAVITKALEDQPDLLGVIGPFSDNSVVQALASDFLKSENVMLMAPFTSSSNVREWNDQVYFTRAEPRTELMVIVWYIVHALRAQRIAYMYLTGVHFGAAEHDSLQETLRSLSHAPASVYSDEYSTTDGSLDTDAFEAMANTHPQVIIVWGMPGLQVEAFLRAVLTDPRTSSACIMTCLALQEIAFNVYYQQASRGLVRPHAAHILSSATSYPPSDTRPLHVQQFHEEMNAYLADPEKSIGVAWGDSGETYVATFGQPRTDTTAAKATTSSVEFTKANPNAAMMMMVGWLAGKLIAHTLRRDDWITSRAAYQTGLFEQNRYLIGGDFVLGDYGGECNALAIMLGATCSCNQGGNTAVLTELDNASWVLVEGAVFTYPQAQCYSTAAQLKRPLNFVTLLIADYPQFAETGIQTVEALSMLLEKTESAAAACTFNTLNTTLATVDEAFAAEVRDYSVDIILGPMLRTLHVPDHLVPTPFFPQPHLVEEQRNYIYLMPTLEQQMFLLYSSLGELKVAKELEKAEVAVVLRNYPGHEVKEITAMLDTTSGTFAVPVPKVTNVIGAASLTGALKAKTINVVLGLFGGDAPTLAAFLTANPEAAVVLTFDDLMIHYEPLAAAFSQCDPTVQARLLSFNSLPLWTDTSDAAHAASPMLKEFHNTFDDPVHHTPAKLLAMIVAAVLRNLMDTLATPDAAALIAAVYRNGLISASSLTFGTFQWECATTATGEECTHKNYGAQNIAVSSMQRFLDPTVPMDVGPRTPSMQHTPRPRTSGFTTAKRNSVIAGSVVGCLLLMAVVALLVYCCTDSRDNDAAPKSHREPVTLIFTDIESSTAMWATLPQLMADAIAAHHRVIRQLIRKYGCYEVKTVGDSFMIACKDAYSAVQLACDIQRKLLKYDWGTDLIDSTYREFEEDRAEESPGFTPPTARLSEEEYAALWCGLRVRIGIHTGLSDIRYDEVTKGYDYYGDTSNMAARTEAIANGGQVVATETTWWALSDEERDAIKCTEMGPQGLRGVPFAVEMYQLNAVPGRTHAALRTEIDAILPDDTATETGSSAAGALLSSVGTMTGAAAGLAFSIASTFAPYPVAQRVRELQPLLNRWGIGAPPRPRHVSEEDYCQGLINRLAVRVAKVAQLRQHMNGAPDGSGVFVSMATTRRASNQLCPPLSSALRKPLLLQASSSPTQTRLFEVPVPIVCAGAGQAPVVPLPVEQRSRRSSRATTFSDCVDAVVPFTWRSATPSTSEDNGSYFGNRRSSEAIGWRPGSAAVMRRRNSRAEAPAAASRTILILPPLPL